MGIGSFGTLSLSPASGSVGDTITVNNTGTGFLGTMLVSCNGTAASATVTAHNELTFEIPVGATTGTVTATNPDGETGSAGTLTVESVAGNQHQSLSLPIAVGIFV